jgi:hypothetical protein
MPEGMKLKNDFFFVLQDFSKRIDPAEPPFRSSHPGRERLIEQSA